ncbi:glycoside hydrolase family 128 protein [Hyaloscypha hepaticicola]|uniref:Glycoside hydrolase family 128 protein n=1 Tax=Hyaloscypha hepaticicola TaxID=2082293 RepID=A0A2J6PYL9_9HELO|nr:glycoside hydrolase family 128 protein [Hyaloscypha hepaticicola]
MHATTIVLLAAATLTSAQATFQRSSKRGLVFVPSDSHPTDNQIWVEGNSDLTWYYNYGVSPSPAYSNRTQEEFEFVPMLWSPSNSFLSSVKSMISGGRNISHIMTYNEPDGQSSTGGSNVDPSVAATNWISQVEPLRKLGVKTGAPAVTGAPSGFTWLSMFFDACASQGTNCTADFFPIHWYGNFGGLASHIGQVAGTYPNKSIWITEYADNNDTLINTQSFFNESAEYFDRIDYIDRYSYFGAFRSDVSNVGPNAAMLTSDGKLTDIGSWYLGGAATNNIPSATGSFGVRVVPDIGAMVVALVAGLCVL